MRTLILALGLAACTEVGVSNFNNPPEVQITSHGDGDTVRFGAPVSLRGAVSDPDGRVEDLVVAWRVDDLPACEDAAPDPEGKTTCEVTFAKDAPGKVVLEVTDARAASAAARLTLAVLETIGEAPKVTLVQPATGSEAELGEAVVFLAVITDSEDDPSELSVDWSSDLDGSFSDQGPDSSGTATFLFDGLSPGAHAIEVAVQDSDGNRATALTTLTIAEAGTPSVDFLELAPDPARTDDVLEATVVGSDPDGDAVTFSTTWYVDGAAVGVVGSTLDGGRWFDKGQAVYAVVTASDGQSTSLPATSQVVTIANTPPSSPEVEILPPEPDTADDLVCNLVSAATDPDGDLLTYRVRWTVDGVDYPRPGDAGPTTTTSPDDTVPSADLQVGQTWLCSLEVSDGEEDAVPGRVAVTIGEAGLEVDYNGIFSITPPIHYDCQLTFLFVRDVVNFDINQLIFVDSGASLLITGAPTTMRQLPAPVDAEFAASGVIAGGCDETYAVSGTFSDEDHWEGLLQLSFTGPDCSLTNCRNQVWPISGARL